MKSAVEELNEMYNEKKYSKEYDWALNSGEYITVTITWWVTDNGMSVEVKDADGNEYDPELVDWKELEQDSIPENEVK